MLLNSLWCLASFFLGVTCGWAAVRGLSDALSGG